MDTDDEGANAFVARRNRQQTATDPAKARALANQAYGQDIRSGRAPSLPQPSDVLTYGASLTVPIAQGAQNALGQADAAVRGAANALTFGGADRLAAASNALVQGGLDHWRQRYAGDLQQELARDRYDSAHRPVAQSAGSVGGGVLGLSAFGPEEAAAAAVPRLAGAAKLTGKEIGAILGGGGLLGFGTQVASDMATNHRSSPGDLGGAVVGGVAGAAAAPWLGPSRAGAIDGAVTAATQNMLNGRPISIPDTAQSAWGGGLLGGVVGSAGRKWSDGLSSTQKGKLGETLGGLRNEFGGEGRWPGRKVNAPLDPAQTGPFKGQKGSTVPDGLAGEPPKGPDAPWPDIFEDKFGRTARLSDNQKIAQPNWGQKFHLNHALPADVGVLFGFPAATFGPDVARQAQDQGR